LALCLALPLLGLLVHAPWPSYQTYYGIPYLLGPAALLAFGVTHTQRRLGSSAIAVVAVVPVLVVGLTDAQEYAVRRHAEQVLADRVITVVAARSGVDSVVVGHPNPPVRAWTGLGPTLNRQGEATGRPWPPAIDVPCEVAASPPNHSRRTLLLMFSSRCKADAQGPVLAVERYRLVDWSRFRVTLDSSAVHVRTGTRVE
jgi:hypothetical protein